MQGRLAVNNLLPPPAAESIPHSAELFKAASLMTAAMIEGRVKINPDGSFHLDGIPFSVGGSSPGETLNGTQAVAAAAQANIFQFDGKKRWIFQYDGKRVIKMKQGGFHYIQMQLKTPYAGVDCKVLVASINCHKLNCVKLGQVFEHNEGEGKGSTPSPCIKAADAVPVDQMVDQTTLQQVRDRLKLLREELETYQATGNEVAAKEAQAEIQELEEYVKENCNRKRSKSFHSGANKNRKKVWVAINRAIDSIEEDHPALALHLRNSIKTGFSCCYAPEKQTEWVL